MKTHERLTLLKPKIRPIGDLHVMPLFKNKHISFAVCEREILINGKKITISRGAIQNPEGAGVLPYIYLDGNWNVVLVEQFRLAIDAVTFEAPGGIVEGDIKKSMARELEEETGIIVNPRDIEIRFREYYLPSLINHCAWGGIVKIQLRQLPKKLESGMALENEYTLVRVVSLLEIQRLRKRFPKRALFDLWTSRLLDEVEKKIK